MLQGTRHLQQQGEAQRKTSRGVERAGGSVLASGSILLVMEERTGGGEGSEELCARCASSCRVLQPRQCYCLCAVWHCAELQEQCVQGSVWSELGVSIPAAQSGAWQGTVVPMDRALPSWAGAGGSSQGSWHRHIL